MFKEKEVKLSKTTVITASTQLVLAFLERAVRTVLYQQGYCCGDLEFRYAKIAFSPEKSALTKEDEVSHILKQVKITLCLYDERDKDTYRATGWFTLVKAKGDKTGVWKLTTHENFLHIEDIGYFQVKHSLTKDQVTPLNHFDEFDFSPVR